jgi:hypothetical protein
MGRDKDGRNGILRPAGAGVRSSSLSSLELFGGRTRLNHLEIMLCLWQLFAIPSAVRRPFIELEERLQKRIDFNDSAAIEPAQRGSVLNRPGVRNP